MSLLPVLRSMSHCGELERGLVVGGGDSSSSRAEGRWEVEVMEREESRKTDEKDFQPLLKEMLHLYDTAPLKPRVGPQFQ